MRRDIPVYFETAKFMMDKVESDDYCDYFYPATESDITMYFNTKC